MKQALQKTLDKYMLSMTKSGDTTAIDSFLEGYGYDPMDIDRIAEKSFKRISFAVRGQINSQKDSVLLEKIAKQFQDAINNNIDKPISYLRNLVASNELSFSHRNLDKLTAEEVQEIIKDQNLIDLLELLDDEKE